MKMGRHMGGKEMHKRKEGGSVDPGKDVYAGKDSPTVKEAEERSRGGGAKKRKAGGGVEHRAEGGSAMKRHDRPGRKRGGGVGSDMRPLTTANKTRDADGHSGDEPESVE